MDISLLVTAAMTVLSPLLTKAGEQAAETIGEKLADKATEKGIWQKIKDLFIVSETGQVIEQIENKPVATHKEVALIEEKLKKDLETNPESVQYFKSVLKITPLNEYFAANKLESIERLQSEIKKLEIQMERAGLGTIGDIQNKIDWQQDKLREQVAQLYEILGIKP
jgi:hypothetical protein